MIKILYIPAGIVGVCLIPVALVLAAPDMWYCAKDVFKGWIA